MICQYFAILCYYKIHHCWFQCLYFTTFPLCRHSVLNSQCALWSLEKSVIVYEDVKVVSLVRMAFCGFPLEFLLVIVVHCASMALTLHSQCVEDILEMQECPMYNLCASTSNLNYRFALFLEILLDSFSNLSVLLKKWQDTGFVLLLCDLNRSNDSATVLLCPTGPT